jgi:hypothetical protein
VADGVFNIAKGRVVEFYNRVENNDPSTSALVVVLLKVVEADGTIQDYDTLAALLAGSNTEAAFTGYARKVLTDSDLAALPAPDDTNNRYDQTWTPTTSETMAKLLVCYDADTGGGTDSSIIPLTFHDFVVTTDSEFTAVINAAGFFRAS